MKKILSILVVTALGLTLWGCPSFDRTTFDTLAVSNSALEAAQVDYETGKLPHTACVHDLIVKGKAAQQAAEAAFLAYYKVEEAKGDTVALQQAVAADVDALAPLIAAVKTAYDGPAYCAAPVAVAKPAAPVAVETITTQTTSTVTTTPDKK